jgi:hypothetical protein
VDLCEEKRVASDSAKGSTLEVWKVGWIFGKLGRSSVAVECSSSRLNINDHIQSIEPGHKFCDLFLIF